MEQEDNGYPASGVRNPRLLRVALQMSRFVFALVPVSELRSRFHNRLGFEPQPPPDKRVSSALGGLSGWF